MCASGPSVELAQGPTISSTNLALTQVALIAALCCACPIWSLAEVVVVACCAASRTN